MERLELISATTVPESPRNGTSRVVPEIVRAVHAYGGTHLDHSDRLCKKRRGIQAQFDVFMQALEG